MKLKICMILPFPQYCENMRIPPQIGICSYLINFGHKVDWILRTDKKQSHQINEFNGVKIYTIYEHYFLPTKLPICKILNKIKSIFIRTPLMVNLIKNNNYNIIIIRDDVFDGLVGVYIKYMYKIHFIFMLSNPLEQNWEYCKVTVNKSITLYLYYLAAAINMFLATWLMHKADLIIPISKSQKEDLVAQGIPDSKIFPISEGVDIHIFKQSDNRDISEKYRLSNAKVIIYIGTLGKARCLKLLIQAFSEVREKRDDAKLLLVGDGDDKEDLKKICCELGINGSVIFTGKIPQADVPSFIALADIGVSPVPPFSFYKRSSPIKMFEYMAMAKPVIANEEIPEHKDVLEQSGGGKLVQFRAEAFANAMIEMLEYPERAAEMGIKGQTWILRNRTYEIMASEVEKGFLNVIYKP